MRPSFVATAPRSITPRPGRSGARVARRASSQMVSKVIMRWSKHNRRCFQNSPGDRHSAYSRTGGNPVKPNVQTAGHPVTTKSYFFDQALLPSGWAADVHVDVASGAITSVTPNASRDGAQHIPGLAIPGPPNLHCHAFPPRTAA